MASAEELASLGALMPFAESLGITFEAASPEEVVATLAWQEDRCTVGGVMHGGALVSLADSAAAVCAFLNLPQGATTSTIDAAASFLRAVRGGSVRAVSRPLHVGRTVIVVRTEVSDGDDRMALHVVQTQAVLHPS